MKQRYQIRTSILIRSGTRAKRLAPMRQQMFGQAHRVVSHQGFQQQMQMGQAVPRTTSRRYWATGSIGRDPTSASTGRTRCNTRS